MAESPAARVAAKRLERASHRATEISSSLSPNDLRVARVMREREQEKRREDALQRAELKADCYRALDDVRSDARSLVMGYARNYKADRNFILAACRLNGKALQHAPPEFHDDLEIVMAAVGRVGSSIEFASPRLRRDRRVLLAAVAHRGVIAGMPEECKADKDIVWAAVVRHGGSSIKHAAASLRADRVFMFEVMKQGGGDPLRFASDALRADREFVLHCVMHNPANLQHASEALRDDREVVMASLRAVDGERCNGGTFEFASDALRADAEFVKAALRLVQPSEAEARALAAARLDRTLDAQRLLCDPRSLREPSPSHEAWHLHVGRLRSLLHCWDHPVPPAVWLRRDVLLTAIDVCVGTFPLLYPSDEIPFFVTHFGAPLEGSIAGAPPPTLASNPGAPQTPRDPEHAAALSRLRGDREVMLAAVRHDGTSLRCASVALRDDRDLVRGAPLPPAPPPHTCKANRARPLPWQAHRAPTALATDSRELTLRLRSPPALQLGSPPPHASAPARPRPRPLMDPAADATPGLSVRLSLSRARGQRRWPKMATPSSSPRSPCEMTRRLCAPPSTRRSASSPGGSGTSTLYGSGSAPSIPGPWSSARGLCSLPRRACAG